MNAETDPLEMVRQSRIRMSNEADNEPSRVIAILRKQEVKYTHQIEKYRLSDACVAEERAEYKRNHKRKGTEGA